MPFNIYIKKSTLKDKKYTAFVYHKDQLIKIVHFGQKGYMDYTIHKDKNRRASYIARHRINENWKDFKTAGFYSRWVTWNKKTLESSIKDLNRRYGKKNTHFYLRL